MNHSTRQSTFSWPPRSNRANQPKCRRKPSRRFVQPRGTLSKPFRRLTSTRAPRNRGIAESLRRRTLILLLLCLPWHGLLAQTANATKPIATLTELQTRINEHLAQPRFAPALWGVKIISLESGKPLFERNAGKLFKPASNAKLFTGALALDRLGPDYRIKTSFYAGTRPDSVGKLHGDLIVCGRGDPTFAARFNNGDHAK